MAYHAHNPLNRGALAEDVIAAISSALTPLPFTVSSVEISTLDVFCGYEPTRYYFLNPIDRLVYSDTTCTRAYRQTSFSVHDGAVVIAVIRNQMGVPPSTSNAQGGHSEAYIVQVFVRAANTQYSQMYTEALDSTFPRSLQYLFGQTTASAVCGTNFTFESASSVSGVIVTATWYSLYGGASYASSMEFYIDRVAPCYTTNAASYFGGFGKQRNTVLATSTPHLGGMLENLGMDLCVSGFGNIGGRLANSISTSVSNFFVSFKNLLAPFYDGHFLYARTNLMRLVSTGLVTSYLLSINGESYIYASGVVFRYLA